MKSLIQVLAAGLICCVGSVAQATIITYNYQAKVISSNYASQRDGIGTPVAIDDILTGVIQYDTAAALDTYQPYPASYEETHIYDAGLNDYISYFDKATGSTFASIPASWAGNAYVTDGKKFATISGSDTFEISHITSVVGGTVQMKFYLYNSSGTAFQSAALPTHLDLAAFQSAYLQGIFRNSGETESMGFLARLTSLEREGADVPEPSTAFLFAIAAGGLFGLHKLRRPSRR